MQAHSTEVLLTRTFDRVLGQPFALEHADRPLPALGIDSLKAMELRGHLWRTFHAEVGVARLLGGHSFNTLLQQLSADSEAAPTALSLQATSAPVELDVVNFDDATHDAPVEIEL
jgi:aryl carrier-like protein